jgi:hypothetical protein
MDTLNDFYNELVDLYGFACETAVAIDSLQIRLSKELSGNNTTNKQSEVFFAQDDLHDREARHQYSKNITELIANNSQNGRNEQLLTRTVVVFVVSIWEDKYRQKISNDCGLDGKEKITSDVFRDLNKIRQGIVHNNGRLKKELRVLNFYKKDDVISLSISQINELFNLLINELNRLAAEYYKQPGDFSIDRENTPSDGDLSFQMSK